MIGRVATKNQANGNIFKNSSNACSKRSTQSGDDRMLVESKKMLVMNHIIVPITKAMYTTVVRHTFQMMPVARRRCNLVRIQADADVHLWTNMGVDEIGRASCRERRWQYV